MHHIFTPAKALALLAFLFVNPIIIGSVYIGMLIIRAASRATANTVNRFVGMLLTCIMVAFVTATALGMTWIPAALFAGVLAWVFAIPAEQPAKPHDCDEKPQYEESDVIDVEVISERTFYKETP